MPGGSAGGAQGFGRFYRNSALTVTSSETAIPLDTVSAFNPNGEPIQVALDSGDIKSFIAGVCVCTLKLHLAASGSAQKIVIRAYHVLPDNSTILVEEARLDAPVSGEPTSFTCIAAMTLDVDSRVRFTAQCDAGTHDVEVGAETETWAYIVIG